MIQIGLPIQNELKRIFEDANINSSDMYLTSDKTGISVSTIYGLIKGTKVVSEMNSQALHSLLSRCNEKADEWETLAIKIKSNIKQITS